MRDFTEREDLIIEGSLIYEERYLKISSSDSAIAIPHRNIPHIVLHAMYGREYADTNAHLFKRTDFSVTRDVALILDATPMDEFYKSKKSKKG